jgi:hypothetical protein
VSVNRGIPFDIGSYSGTSCLRINRGGKAALRRASRPQAGGAARERKNQSVLSRKLDNTDLSSALRAMRDNRQGRDCGPAQVPPSGGQVAVGRPVARELNRPGIIAQAR